MNYSKKIWFIVILMTGFLTQGYVAADIIVEPLGFALSVEQDDEAEVEFEIINSGEVEVGFSFDSDRIEDEENRGVGPRRDDLGDEIDAFNSPNGGANAYNAGIAWDWDNEWMWITTWSNPWPLVAVDPADDYEAVERWNMPSGCMGAFCYDGVIYVVPWANQYLFRFSTDGENLGNLNLNFQPTAVTGSHEEGLLMPMNAAGGRDVHVLDIEDDFEQIATIQNYSQYTNNNASRSLLWVDKHPDGQMWFNTRRGGNGNDLWQVSVDMDEWEFTDQVAHVVSWGNGNGQEWDGVGHDGENLWLAQYSSNQIRIIDDGINEIYLVEFQPDEGFIEGDDATNITVLIHAEEVEAGTYNFLIQLELFEPEEERDDLEQSLIEFSIVITVDDPTFDLSGIVTDAATDETVEGVRMEPDLYMIARFTDGDGEYSYRDLPMGEYQFTFTATDYLPFVADIEVDEAGEAELDIEMLHSECTPDEERFFWEMEPETEHIFRFNVTNGGNGPLTYQVDRRLLGEANADPWTLRREADLEEAVDDNQLNGVVYANGRFIVSGGNRGQDVNKIYIFNAEGELISEVDQVHDSRYGIRDLTFDGELVWGADDDILYSYDTDGEFVDSFEGEAASYRSLAWDADRQVFWSADITSDFWATDLDGNLVETVDREGDMRTYGLAYWPDDPDGYQLYAFSRGVEDTIDVNKINLETGETMVAAGVRLEEAGRPGGINITNQLDIYSWVMVCMVQNPDRLAIWQLEGRREWFQINPEEGEIAAEESQEFTLTLDATGLPSDNLFEGELVFTHDGVGSETIIPVSLNCVEGEIHTRRQLDLHMGWNSVSVNLQPDEEDVEVLTAELVEAELLIMMKNGAGQFYRPDFEFNNIPGWFVNEGYQIKMSDAATLILEGTTVLQDEAIALEQGWQLISYYPRSPVEATVALSSIADHLIIAKDGYGNFYLPEWEFSNMGDMRPGQGYYVNVDQNIELVYNLGEERAMQAGNVQNHSSIYDEPGKLPVHQVTGSNMSLLVLGSPPLNPPLHSRRGEVSNTPPLLRRGGIEGGVEIAVFTSGELVGSGILQQGQCGIAIWGDDPSTEVVDGALEGQPLDIKLLLNGNLEDLDYSLLSGKTTYETDGLAVIELIGAPDVPEEYGIVSVYPNPFNSRMRVSFGLPEASDVILNLYDLTGRQVMELAGGHYKAGIHTTVIDGSNMASGVYLLRFEAGAFSSQTKVMLLK